jgi:O-antigen/teichoic acid export membrane protein
LSELKILLKQSSHYFAGHIFVLVTGFISFPIFTRIFSVADYGILGFITTTIFILTAIAKLGVPSGTIRFYAEFKTEGALTKLYTTMFLGSLLASGLVTAFFVVSIQLIPDKFINKYLLSLLSLVSILIFTRSSIITLTTFLRAEQKTKLYNLILIVRRLGSLSISILLVFYLIKGLHGFYFGQIVSSAIILCFLIYLYRSEITKDFTSFSLSLLKDSIKFGFPLIWAELGHLILNYADRYLIQFYLGSVSLGLYTAGYNLATHVTEAIMYPINYAMVPIYMNILVNKGEEPTREFFSKLFKYFLLIIIPITFGFMAIGEDLIAFLASVKYIKAHIIFPYVIIGQSVYASSIILNSGLFIRKKTHIVTMVMIGACLLNIALNTLLIPHFGIVGAAQATLISSIFYTILITYFAFKEFSFPIHHENFFLYLVASLIMYIIIRKIQLGSHLFNLVSRVFIGVAIYSILVIIFDREIRANFLTICSKVMDRSHKQLIIRN